MFIFQGVFLSKKIESTINFWLNANPKNKSEERLEKKKKKSTNKNQSKWNWWF